MTTRIEATRLIPGRGEVVDNGVVIFADSAISYAGAANGAPETPDADVVSTDTVMPGMWECHGHFMGIYTANIDEVWTTRPQLAAMRVTADARRALHAGFTSVRELGGLGSFLSFAVEEGQVEGPNVYASGSALSMTGGHGDVREDHARGQGRMSRHHDRGGRGRVRRCDGLRPGHDDGDHAAGHTEHHEHRHAGLVQAARGKNQELRLLTDLKSAIESWAYQLSGRQARFVEARACPSHQWEQAGRVA
ncbi:MAG: hypothetical protein IH918_07985, partial [Acidobacteria bacterium]|nr:hypothetical protein [Acidobacteriota bacterium]